MIFVKEPGERNYALIAGQSFHDAFTIKQNGIAVDLSSWTARLSGKRNLNEAEAEIELTTENNGIVLGGVAGTVVLQATPATVREWGVGSFHYQLEFEQSGVVQTYLMGRFTIAVEIA